MATKKNHIYTNKERKKIYKTPKVKNTAKKTVPTKKSEIPKRRQIVKDHINPLMWKIVYCPALGANVGIYDFTKTEMKGHSVAKHKSTTSVLNLETAVSNAVKIYEDDIKTNITQQRYFTKMHALVCKIKGIGFVKITVGEIKSELRQRYPEKYGLYCITALSGKEIKKKR